MNMAKASKEEWERVMKFSNELDENTRWPKMTDKDLGAWVRKAPCLFRIVFGYQVLVDNACDPDDNVLSFKKEIREAIEAARLKESPSQSTSDALDGANFYSKRCGELEKEIQQLKVKLASSRDYHAHLCIVQSEIERLQEENKIHWRKRGDQMERICKVEEKLRVAVEALKEIVSVDCEEGAWPWIAGEALSKIERDEK